MALNDIPTDTMLELTRTWVTEDHPHRDALASIPVLAALLPEIEEAHAELDINYRRTLTTERILAIMHTLKRLDDRHDNVLRTIWHRLMSESYFSRDSTRSLALQNLRTTLLPEGLDATQKAYGEEAEQAVRMAERLSSDDRALLASIPLSDETTLLDAIDEWIAVAAQLGNLEAERRRGLMATTQGERDGQDVSSRNQWLRTIHAVRTVASLVARRHHTIREMMAELNAAERDASAPVALLPSPSGVACAARAARARREEGVGWASSD